MHVPSFHLAAIVVTLIGCTPAVDPQLPPDAVKLADATEVILEQSYSGIEDRSRLVIRDAHAWSAFWNQAYRSHIPLPSVPEIDFGRNIVIVAGMGSRNTGGYGITFHSVHEADDVLYVVVRESSPGRSCIVTQALTQPVIAVRVSRPNAHVKFIERSETFDCRS
ncbi:MAG: protease complex subunit PrcB family protein [Gemmatimonadaceae bacterium]